MRERVKEIFGRCMRSFLVFNAFTHIPQQREEPQEEINFLSIGESKRTDFSLLDVQLSAPSHANMFFFQLVIMSCTVLLAYYMECTDLFSVHVQGFFCNDAELMKPYPGTEEASFIPPLILYCVVAAAPTAIVSTSHLVLHCLAAR